MKNRAWRAAFLLSIAMEQAAAAGQIPPTLQVGEKVPELASCGTRNTLWIDHYVAALYLPPGASPVAAQDPSAPKAVRIQVINSRFMPEKIPEQWREALARELEREPMTRIRSVYGALSAGDVVVLAYVPATGVTMQVNGHAVMRSAGHEAIDAVLAAWAENDPISGKLRRLALEHPCASRASGQQAPPSSGLPS
jgi:hypothetical protein